MKLMLKKNALKVLTDLETQSVGGGGNTDTCTGVTGTECGVTYLPECGTTGTATAIYCTNDCATAEYDCTHNSNCGS